MALKPSTKPFARLKWAAHFLCANHKNRDCIIPVPFASRQLEYCSPIYVNKVLLSFSLSCYPLISLSLLSILYNMNRIGGVMVNVLALSTVDRGFEPRSSQTKDYKIGICCFSAMHEVLRRKNKD